jgi:hypothetical protein
MAKTGRRENGVNDLAMNFGDDWNAGLSTNARALADQLFPVFYDELRRLAHREHHRVGATLQTTALVNEAYLPGEQRRTENRQCAPPSSLR